MTTEYSLEQLNDIGSDVDLSEVPPINQKRLLAFINEFLINTISLLNDFYQNCESRLHKFDLKVQKLEAELCILESKLKSIPGLEVDIPKPTVTPEVPQPQAEQVAPNLDLEHDVTDSSSAPANDSDEETLFLTAVFRYMWLDTRLILTKSSHILSISPDEIWSGTARIAYEAGSKFLELGMGQIQRNSATILGRGLVIGGVVVKLQSVRHCHSDLTNWPYDTKICNIHFISPEISGGRVLFKTVNHNADEDGQLIKDTVVSKGWFADSVKFNTTQNGSQFFINLHLRRKGAKLANYFYLPATINLLITLSLFFLKPQSKERFVLLLLATIMQFYFLKSLSLLVPNNHNQRPTIEYFIEMSTILILIQIFLVILCRAIVRTECNPSFLSKLVSIIIMSRAFKTFLLLDVDPKDANELIEEQDDDESFLIAIKTQTKKKVAIDI